MVFSFCEATPPSQAAGYSSLSDWVIRHFWSIFRICLSHLYTRWIHVDHFILFSSQFRWPGGMHRVFSRQAKKKTKETRMKRMPVGFFPWLTCAQLWYMNKFQEISLWLGLDICLNFSFYQLTGSLKKQTFWLFYSSLCSLKKVAMKLLHCPVRDGTGSIRRVTLTLEWKDCCLLLCTTVILVQWSLLCGL